MRAVLLLWLLWQPLPALSQQPPARPKPPVGQADSNKKPPQQDQRGTQPSPFVVKLDSVQANTQSAQSDEQHRDESSANWWIARFTGALVFVAVIQLGMFAWQLKQIRGGLADTKKAADAAEISAKAADLSAQAAVNVERPHVSCTAVIVKEISRGGTQDPETGVWTPTPDTEGLGESYEVRFVFTNYGRTPANDIRIGWGCGVGEAPPAPAEWKMLANIQRVLKPGEVASFRLPESLNIKPQEQKAIDEDKASPWFWGFISYSDFFDGVAEIGFLASQSRTAELSFARSASAYTFRRYTIGGGKTSQRG